MNNKIHQTGFFRLIEASVASGSATIWPGMLVEQTVAGVRPHSTAGGFAERLVAQEDALQGGTVLGTFFNGAYVGYTYAGINAQGPDKVQIYSEVPGSLGLHLLLAGFVYTEGIKLISDGAGNLKPTTGTPNQIIAVITALGAVDLSASGAVNTLSQVRYL